MIFGRCCITNLPFGIWSEGAEGDTEITELKARQVVYLQSMGVVS